MEPLNIFLYTWRFLATLLREEEHLPTKKVFRWYAILSGWTVPLLYYCFFVAIVITNTYYDTYYFNGKTDEAAHWLGITISLTKSLGYFITITNCLACFTMVLIVHYAHKLTKPILTAFGEINSEEVQEQRKLHSLVTSMNVILIMVYTVLSVLVFNVYSGQNS